MEAKAAFSGFSVDDQAKAKDFYVYVLGLKLIDESMGLRLGLPGGSGEVFAYPKSDHSPASFTILNFVVEDIDAAANALRTKGVTFEQYDNLTDEKGIARGKSKNMGPDIAWFKDPAGNILSILTDD